MVSRKRSTSSASPKLTRELVIAGLLTMCIQFGISWALPQVAGAPVDNGGTQQEMTANDNGAGNSDQNNGNSAPDGMPAAIGQADGSMYTYKEEVVGEDGSHSYIYSGEDEDFEGGGLGDAELIITEDGTGGSTDNGNENDNEGSGETAANSELGSNSSNGSSNSTASDGQWGAETGIVGETQQEYYTDADGEEMPETTVSIG